MKPVHPHGTTSPSKAKTSKEQSATKPVQSQGATSPPKAQKNKEKSPEVQKNNEKSLPKRTKQGAKSSCQPQLPGENQKPTEKQAEAKQGGESSHQPQLPAENRIRRTRR